MGDQEKPELFSIDAPTKKAIARITRREHCGCSKAAPELHSESQNDGVPGWQKALTWVEDLTKSHAEVLEPSSISWEEWMDVITLPSSIESLANVKAIRLYGSHLRRIPPEIGRMHALRELDIYTSYSLHWLPYELTRCRQLKKSRMSTRAMFGNRKTHVPFPRLGAPLAALTPASCSVCDREFGETPELFWHTLRLGTDDVPLLIHSCSAACTRAVPDAPVGYSKRPHKGGPVSIIIDNLADFVEFVRRVSRKLRHVTVTPLVWEQIAADNDVIEQVIRLEDLPMKVLRTAATHPQAEVRRTVARRALAKELYARLAEDPEMEVRRALARNRRVPPAILKSLLDDPSKEVRSAAAKRLA